MKFMCFPPWSSFHSSAHTYSLQPCISFPTTFSFSCQQSPLPNGHLQPSTCIYCSRSSAPKYLMDLIWSQPLQFCQQSYLKCKSGASRNHMWTTELHVGDQQWEQHWLRGPKIPTDERAQRSSCIPSCISWVLCCKLAWETSHRMFPGDRKAHREIIS